MVSCGFCGHPGVHATIANTYGSVRYCTGCKFCQDELAKAKAQAVPSSPATGETKSGEESDV